MANNKKLQIAFIGGGMIANAHMRDFHDNRRTEIRGLADLNKTALNNAGAEYGIPHLTTDYKALLKDPKIDAIVVCTPPGLHCKIGIDVLRAGKDLIMEKPLTRTPTEARRLLKEASKHPDLLATGCSCRHARVQPKYPFTKKMIYSGKIGGYSMAPLGTTGQHRTPRPIPRPIRPFLRVLLALGLLLVGPAQ